ncbi:MAG: oligosaccharide flippase family protein [Promethearchaeota archaeon]
MELQERDRFVQNSYILMIGYLMSSAISSIGTIIMIRLISVEEYSFITIAYIIPAILIVISELGLNFASTHFIARKIKEESYKDVRNIIKINLIIKIIISIFFTLIVIIFSNYIAKKIYNIQDDRMVLLIQLASIGIIANILYDTINSFFLGALNTKMVQIGTILQTSLRTILTISLILVGFTLFGPMIGFVLPPLIVVIIYLFLLKKFFFKENTNNEAIDWKKLSEMVKYGYPLFLYSIIISIHVQCFVLILTIYGFLTEVSYFNVAIVSASVMGILTKSIKYTLFPIFSKKDWDKIDEREKLIKTFQFSLKFCSLLILPVTILLILFSGNTFPLIFGEKYREASPFISIYLFIFLLCSFGYLSIPAFFNGQKKTKYVFLIELLEFLASLIFALILINFYGGIGVIFGIVIGTVISVFFGNILILKEYGKVLYSNLHNIIIIFVVSIFCGFLTYIIYNILGIFIYEDFILFKLLKLALAFSFYMIIFLLLIGFFSQITLDELTFFENTFEKFPVVNKIIFIISNFEKRIIRIRKK